MRFLADVAQDRLCADRFVIYRIRECAANAELGVDCNEYLGFHQSWYRPASSRSAALRDRIAHLNPLHGIGQSMQRLLAARIFYRAANTLNGLMLDMSAAWRGRSLNGTNMLISLLPQQNREFSIEPSAYGSKQYRAFLSG